MASAEMSSARSRLRTTRWRRPAWHGASVKPQLPITTLVTPCQHEQVPSGSQKTWASMCVWPSMKPGATTWPSASISSRAALAEPAADARDPAARTAHVRPIAGQPRAVDHRAARGSPGRRTSPHPHLRPLEAVQLGDVVVEDRSRSAGLRCAVCSASTSCDHGHVESLCGKSFAHMSRRQFRDRSPGTRPSRPGTWCRRARGSTRTASSMSVARRQPVAVPLVGVVHPVHVVRHPAGVGLDAHDACSFGCRSNTPPRTNMPMMSWQPRMIDEEAVEPRAPRLEAVRPSSSGCGTTSGRPRSTAASRTAS